MFNYLAPETVLSIAILIVSLVSGSLVVLYKINRTNSSSSFFWNTCMLVVFITALIASALFIPRFVDELKTAERLAVITSEQVAQYVNLSDGIYGVYETPIITTTLYKEQFVEIFLTTPGGECHNVAIPIAQWRGTLATLEGVKRVKVVSLTADDRVAIPLDNGPEAN